MVYEGLRTPEELTTDRTTRRRGGAEKDTGKNKKTQEQVYKGGDSGRTVGLIFELRDETESNKK